MIARLLTTVACLICLSLGSSRLSFAQATAEAADTAAATEAAVDSSDEAAEADQPATQPDSEGRSFRREGRGRGMEAGDQDDDEPREERRGRFGRGGFRGDAFGEGAEGGRPEGGFRQRFEGPRGESPRSESLRAEAPPTAGSAQSTSLRPAPASPALADGDRLMFNFRYQPWQDVLDWFADQAGLSLLIESPPSGTFNYRDSREYTLPQAMDVLNGVLLTKGYTLVRRDRMLVLVNLEDGIPPNLVPDVPLSDLDARGEYELVRVLFPVWNMSPEQAAAEVEPLLGPQGKAVILPQARQVQVTETAGRLRTIRSVINAVEMPDQGTAGVREFQLKYLTVDGAMPTIRQMLGIPDEAFGTPDGSLQITKSAIGEKVLVRGSAQHAARLQEVLRLIDVPEAAAGIGGTPQLEVYPITSANPDAVLRVLQTMMSGERNVNLSSDPQTGYIIAFAGASQQSTIRATIDQMQKDARQLDVIPLSVVDPQTAVLAISKLYGSSGAEPDPMAPRVDADTTSRSLLVRGTPSQVLQIRQLLRQMGETDDGTGRVANRQNVRLLPLTGHTARSAIAQLEEIWPSVRQNRLRIVVPSTTIQTYRPGDASGGQPSPSAPATGFSPQQWQLMPEEDPSASAPRPAEQPPVDREAARTPASSSAVAVGLPLRSSKAVPLTAADRSADLFRLVAQELVDDQQQPANEETSQQPIVEPSVGSAATLPAGPRSPILVAPGPGGVVIASDDLEALDQLESLLSSMAERTSVTGREYAIFYLKYTKAATIADVLTAVFGGGNTGGRGNNNNNNNNDRGMIGEMANNALGDMGGALMGDLLLGSRGASVFTSATVDIVPDARLNALIVHARPTDLDTIEQLLKVLDQRSGPEEVEAELVPRTIPVYNATASDIAAVVQQVYQDRIAGSGVMSPQEMVRMIRGGPGGDQQSQKMTIGIDERNNLLILRAPDPLFDEVEALINHLDQSLGDSPQRTEIISLQHTNSAAVHRALTSMLPNVTTNTTGRDDRGRGRGGQDEGDSPADQARRNAQRQMEMVRQMQQMQERMNRGEGRGGGGEGGRGGGGGARGGGQGGGGGGPAFGRGGGGRFGGGGEGGGGRFGGGGQGGGGGRFGGGGQGGGGGRGN